MTWIYDLESDGLLDAVTKIHCVVMKKYGHEEWLYFVDWMHLKAAFKLVDELPGKHIVGLLNNLHHVGQDRDFKNERLVCHNQLAFDLLVLKKVRGVDWQRDRLTDTLVASQFLNADQPQHSLEYYGKKFGPIKVHVEDWQEGSIETYLTRCMVDVQINERVYEHQRRELENDPRLLEGMQLAHEVRKEMVRQEVDGAVFDLPAAVQLLDYVKKEMAGIETEVHPQLGEMELPKSKQPTFPKRPFKKTQELSVTGKRYMEKTGISEAELRVLYLDPSKPTPRLKKPVTLIDKKEVKAFLVNRLGWIPTLWSYKQHVVKGKDRRQMGKAKIRQRCIEYAADLWNSPYRGPIWDELDMPKPLRVSWAEANNSDLWPGVVNFLVKNARALPTHPQFQDPVSRQMCPNLEKLDGPLAKQIVKWMSYNHRKGLLEGWIKHPRMHVDRRLPAGSKGFTNTFRQKHTCVANVPKAQESILLGKEMRQLFTAPEGMVCVGVDASNLEARCAGEAAWDHDGGAFAKIVLEGDWHSMNAAAYSAVADRIIARQDSKPVSFGILYGCGGVKAARMLGVEKKIGHEIVGAFWDTNPGLKAKRDALIEEFQRDGRFIRGIDGRRLCGRSEYSLLNTYVQNLGAVCMDRAAYIAAENLDSSKCQRFLYMHDELNYYSSPDYAEQCGKIVEDAITQAGEFYRLRVILVGEAKIGRDWSKIH